MAGEWATLPLGEVAAVRSGYAFKSSDWTESGVPVVKIANVKGGRLEMAGCSFVDEAVANGAGDFRLSDGDILIAMTGYVGDVARVRKTDLPCVLNQRVGKFTVLNSERLDASYLFLFLASVDTRQTIAGLGYGSAQPNVSPSLIHKVKIPLPSLPEQKRIAHILGTLDDKIELNRRMNATLEGISRAIFKSWFVDFDPVRQKAAGKQPVGMDVQTAALFPDSFEDSEIGEVPKGWRVDAFADHFDADRGLSYKGEGLREDGSGVPMHNLNSVYEGGGYKHEGIKYYAGEYRDKHLISPGDVIVTNTEQGFDHLLIGHAAIVPACFGTTGLYSHHIYRLRCKPSSPLTPHYVASLLNDPRWHYWISGFSNGTTINMLPLDALQMPLLVVPPPRLVQMFDQLATSTHERREASLQQSRTLAALRDTLLPKLLSGEIPVPEAEDAVEEAVQ